MALSIPVTNPETKVSDFASEANADTVFLKIDVELEPLANKSLTLALALTGKILTFCINVFGWK